MGVRVERVSPPPRDGNRVERRAAAPAPQATRDLLRAINHHVRRFAVEIGGGADVDFVCECPSRECFRVVRLTQEEFELVTATPGRYVVCREHVGDGERVVEETRHYTVVARAD